MSYSNTHHSFSVELAIKYGQEIATLIHHFQHWIKLNRRKKSPKHFKDGHWWTYQTREEIQNFLPYMNIDKIRWLTDLMVEKGILKKGNYNKSKIDKTIWYAFVNENEFLGEEDSNNVYESCKPQSSVVNPNPCVVYPNAIPDPKSSDTKTTDKDLNSSSEVKKKETGPSAQASVLADEFYLALKDAHGEDFKKPNLENWAMHFDRMIRIDGREPSMIRKIMNWAVNDSFWKPNILSAAKLRDKFLTLKLQMERPQQNQKKSFKSEEAQWKRKDEPTPAEIDILTPLLASLK